MDCLTASAMPGDPLAAASGPTGPESEPSPAASPLPPPPSPPPAPAAPSPRQHQILDRQGLLEATAGTVIALIALFSSYDHITLADHTIPLQQQWGVWFIAASLALVFIDAELATRSRSREKARLDREEHRHHREEHRRQREEDSREREAHEANRERNRAAEERIRADQERSRADRERNRASEAAERQRQATARLHACALFGGRFQLNPSPANATRYRAFLALMADVADAEG